MTNQDQPVKSESVEERKLEIGYDPKPRGSVFFIDITVFSGLLKTCFEFVGAKRKKRAIDNLLAFEDWVILHTNHQTDCSVYAEKEVMDHAHEIITARALTALDYDVLFAPNGMFGRDEKRFDVFLIRGHIILKADLKSISSKNPDTIANRITRGARQANRMVIDIVSDIEPKLLVDGLRSGVVGLKDIKEILLLYRNRFYRLTRQEIMGKNIYKLLQ